MRRVTRKQTLRYDTDLLEFESFDFIDHIIYKSMSYQKKDGCGHMRPSLFWYDNDKDLKVCFSRDAHQMYWVN